MNGVAALISPISYVATALVVHAGVKMEQLVQMAVTEKPNARGIAVNICNDYIYGDGKCKPLFGSRKDCETMISAFGHIKFSIISRNNATKNETVDLIKAVASYKFPYSYKYIVLVFSCRGDGRSPILSSDGEVVNLNDDIINPLAISQYLKEKQKCIFIATDKAEGFRDQPFTHREKVLIAFSPECEKCDTNGSSWIKMLAKEIQESSRNISDILMEINGKEKFCLGFTEEEQAKEPISDSLKTGDLTMQESTIKEMIKTAVDNTECARGIAVIVCNDYINGISKKAPVHGSRVDAEAMESTFKHINFAIIRKDNPMRDLTVGLIQEVATYKFPESYKFVVVVFAGHANGKPAIISGDDKNVYLNENVIEPLDSDNLEGKRKLIFIGGCRDAKENDKPLKIPSKVVVAFSTGYGHWSADSSIGCVWLQELAEQIKVSSKTIGEILGAVNEYVKDITSQNAQVIGSSTNFCLGLSAEESAAVPRSESEEPCKKKMKTKVYRNDGCLPIAATPETMTAKNIIVKEEDVSFLTEVLCTYAYKWEHIGLALTFLPGELIAIPMNNHRGSVQQFLREVLNQWIQWPTDDHREEPTLDKLCAALRGRLVGLGAVANKLHAKRTSLPSQCQP